MGMGNNIMLKHDAHRQVGYIQQALSQNKNPIGVFLGAGCPLSIKHEIHANGKKVEQPLIPDVAGLTKMIQDKLKSNNEGRGFIKLVEQVKQDNKKNDKNISPNIELILSHLRSLKQVAGSGTVRDFKAEELDKIDRTICNEIFNLVNKELPNENTPYHDLAIWAREIPRHKPIHIFTTNYDLLIEEAFEESECPYSDGFVGSKNAFFDLGAVEDDELLNPRWCRLWKIHGSINWKMDKKKRILRGDKPNEDENYLIYPSHLKYDQSRKMPYLAMLDRLKDFILDQYSVLFIVGYSFSDDHINDIIIQSLKNNSTAMCFGFLFENLEQEKYNNARECAKQVSNLSLIAQDKGVIGRQEGKWFLNNEDLLGEIPAQIVNKVNAEKKEDTPEDIIDYEFTIGNFSKFGEFLKEMSIKHYPEEVNDEK